MLIMAGAMTGSTYLRNMRQTHQGPALVELNQRLFGTAAMSVCGRGLWTPGVDLRGGGAVDHRPLVEFLSQQRDSLQCSEIADTIPLSPLDGVHRHSRYLLVLVTTAWTVGDISWASIDWLMGALFGLSAALAFLLCRLTMTRVLSTGVAATWLLSPMHLANLTDLRDYAKAPFFVLGLIFIALLTIRERRLGVVAALAGVAGALLGFGYGMRTDVIVCLFLLMAAVAMFLPAPSGRVVSRRLVALTACLAGFATLSIPLRAANSFDPGIWHWGLLGYAHQWDQGLDITPSLYEPAYFYSDSYQSTTVDAFWNRMTNGAQPTSYGSPAYRQASRDYYLTLLSTFPADALLRGWASLIQVLNLPFDGIHSIPQATLPEWLRKTFDASGRARVVMAGCGPVLFAVAVMATALKSLRFGALLFFVVAVLGAYTAVQFQLRHVFQLELLSLWIVGFLIDGGAQWLVRRRLGHHDADTQGRGWRSVGARLAVATVVVAVAVVLPLTILRSLQYRRALSLFADYSSAATEALTISAASARPGVTLLAVTPQQDRPHRSMHSELLVAELSASNCPVDRPSITFRYAPQRAEVDFTRTYIVEAGSAVQPTRVFFPIFETGATNLEPSLLAFSGLELADAERPCVARISRVKEPDRFRLLIPVVLRPSWRDDGLHYTLRGWPIGPYGQNVGAITYHWSPERLANNRSALAALLDHAAPLVLDRIEYAADIVRVRGSREMVVDGVAEGSGTYLVAWQARSLKPTQVIAIEGQIDRGGLSAGLTGVSGWANRIDLDTPGPFRIFLQAPHEGAFQLVLANFLSNTSLRNRITIARVALLDDSSPASAND